MRSRIMCVNNIFINKDLYQFFPSDIDSPVKTTQNNNNHNCSVCPDGEPEDII